MEVKRLDIQLKADSKRVILRFLGLNPERTEKLLKRVLAIPEGQFESLYSDIKTNFGNRHRNPEHEFLKHFKKISHLIPDKLTLTEIEKLVIGAYFSMEYSIQAAALFNASIVKHPDQSNAKDGEICFIMSLRAVGEGHISSIEFRSGIITGDGLILMDEVSSFCTLPELNPIPIGKDKGALSIKTEEILDYNLEFKDQIPLSERVIFPTVNIESMGMEDVRFVEFSDGDNSSMYVGTYTAYDGRNIKPRLIVTTDFLHFDVRTIHGQAASDKGFALFPEKINGRYAMIARQGGEDITIMFSDNLYHWDDYNVILSPEHHWGLVQTGNCGSPLKTIDGWLLITPRCWTGKEICDQRNFTGFAPSGKDPVQTF